MFIGGVIMRLKKIKTKKGVHFNLTQTQSKYVISTESNDPKLPALFVFCGSRGSGKTYACVAMVRHFEKMKYITRTFLICPTKQSNDIFNNLKTLNEKKDVCDDENKCKHALSNILTEVKREWNNYEQDVKYAQAYKRYTQKPWTTPMEDRYILESRNFAKPTPIHRPSHLLIVDDCQGTDMYTMARRDLMNHMTIKHRHIPLTICYLVQSWTGLPRVIRLNATHFLIYKTGNKKQLSQIYDNFATFVTEAQFLEVYQHATSQPYGFLYIDTDPKEPHMRFRNGFNEFFDLK